MTFPVFVSRKLHRLHLKRVSLMDAASAARRRDNEQNQEIGKKNLEAKHSHRTESTTSHSSIGEVNKDPNNPPKNQKRRSLVQKVGNGIRLACHKEQVPSSSQGGQNVTTATATTSELPGFMRERRRRRQEKRMTIVMFCATACFVGLVLPQCINGLLEWAIREAWMKDQHQCYLWVENVSICLFNLHFTVNFFIYMSVNSSFRLRVRRLLRLDSVQLRSQDHAHSGYSNNAGRNKTQVKGSGDKVVTSPPLNRKVGCSNTTMICARCLRARHQCAAQKNSQKCMHFLTRGATA